MRENCKRMCVGDASDQAPLDATFVAREGTAVVSHKTRSR